MLENSAHCTLVSDGYSLLQFGSSFLIFAFLEIIQLPYMYLVLISFQFEIGLALQQKKLTAHVMETDKKPSPAGKNSEVFQGVRKCLTWLAGGRPQNSVSLNRVDGGSAPS